MSKTRMIFTIIISIIIFLGYIIFQPIFFNYQLCWTMEKHRMKSKKDPIKFIMKDKPNPKIETLIVYVHFHNLELTKAMGGPSTICKLSPRQREDFKKKFWEKAKQDINYFNWGNYSPDRYYEVIAYEIPRLAAKEGIFVLPNDFSIGNSHEIVYQISTIKSISQSKQNNWNTSIDFPIIDLDCQYKVGNKELNVGPWNISSFQAIFGSMIIYNSNNLKSKFNNQPIESLDYEKIKNIGKQGLKYGLFQCDNNSTAIQIMIDKIFLDCQNNLGTYEEFVDRNMVHESQHLIDYQDDFQSEISSCNHYLIFEDYQHNMGSHQELSAMLSEFRYSKNRTETLANAINCYDDQDMQDPPHFKAANWIIHEMIKIIKHDIQYNQSKEYLIFLEGKDYVDWQILWQITDLVQKPDLLNKLIENIHQKYTTTGYRANLAPHPSLEELLKYSLFLLVVAILIFGYIFSKKYIPKKQSTKRK